MDLQKLLRFAIEKTNAEDAEEAINPDTYAQMDDERKGFLDSALKAMTLDVMKEFQIAINVLENSSSLPAEKLHALNTIRDYIDDMDFANNFAKVGGSKILLHYLNSEDSQLRVAAIYIIAEMSQNNPFCQQHFLDAKVIATLVSYFKESEDIASSALHAVSSLVRNFEPAAAEFLSNEGVAATLSCLSANQPRTFVKACFIIATLSSEYSAIRDEFVKKSAIPKLFSNMDSVCGFDIKTETVLFALAELTKSDEWKTEIKNSKYMNGVLKELIDKNKLLPQCEEMIMYAKMVQTKL